MDDQRDSRNADSSPQTSAEEATAEATPATVARMLANPRRVRRA